MVADERAEEQSRELVADRLVESEHGRRAPVLDSVQASAMLENEGQATGLLRGDVHQSAYRRWPAARRSLPGVSGLQSFVGSPVCGADSGSGAAGAPPSRM